MTDLMSTLYDYVLTQSESYLAVYPEYRLGVRTARVGLLYAKIPIFYPKTM